MDIAELGFQIDSQPAVRAASNLDNMTKAAARAEDGTSKMAKKMNSELRTTQKAATAMNSSLKDIASTVMGGLGVAGFTALLGGAVVKSREFGKAWAEVTTLLNDTNGIDSQRTALLGLSKLYGTTATEQAKAYYQAISSGATAGAQALALLSTANKLAIGGVTNTATAVDGLTSIMNAYVGKVRSATDVSDTMFVGMKAGKTTIGELSGSLGQVAPLASTVGVEFHELVSAISAVTLGGVKTSEAVTQVRAMLAAVIRPTQEAADTAKALGLEFNTNAIRAKGFQGFLQDIVEKTGGSEQSIASLFGSIEGLNGALALTGTQAGAFDTILQQMEQRAGQTDVAYNKLAETTDQKFNKALSAASVMLIDLGDVLANIVAPAADFFANNAGAIASVLKIGLTVGTAYAVLFVGLPMLYNAATVAAWRFAAAVSAGNTSMSASMAKMGALGIAASTALAAFAGWQIGKELSAQFLEVRLAGISLVQGLLERWEELKAVSQITWLAVKYAALQSFDAIRMGMAGVIETMADVQSKTDVFGLAPGITEDLRGLALGIRGAQTAGAEFDAQVAQISGTLQANKKAIADDFSALADYEIAQEMAKKATEGTNAALAGTAGAAGSAGEGVVTLSDTLVEATESAQLYVKSLLDEVATFGMSEEALRQYELAHKEGLTPAMQATASAALAQIAANKKLAAAWQVADTAAKTLADRTASLRDRIAQQNDRLRGLSATQIAINATKREAANIENELRDGKEGLTDAYKAELDAMVQLQSQYEENEDAITAQSDEAERLASILSGLDEIGLSGLLQDMDLLNAKLAEANAATGEAFDPQKVAALNAAIGMTKQKMVDGIVGASQDGLRSLQSMTEGGSDAFRALQVAIDALTVVQAISAVLNQGNGDPYTAFARMAAMAAAVASLGVSVGGLAGGFGGGAQQAQQAQGTGSVLGDASADSASIARATDITADATSQLVGLNRGMLTALQAMQAGLSGASNLLARGAGGADFAAPGAAPLNFATRASTGALNILMLGIFDNLLGSITRSILGARSKVTDTGLLIGGGTLSALLDGITVSAFQEVSSRSWWFGNTHTNTETQSLGEDVAAQFQLVLNSMADAVRSGAEALGLNMEEVNAAIAAYQIEEIRISTMDLSPEEAQAELEAVFGKIFDGLAGSVVPFIGQFQQVGEGLGETLVRVATGVQVTQEAVRQLGFALDETDPEAFAQVSEGLIGMAGGIDAFISSMSDFVNAFAPESHKFELAQAALNTAFAEAGLVLPETRDGMWQLMQSLDATTESGQMQIATLLRLAGTADEFYSTLEQREEDALQAAEEAAAAMADYNAIVADLNEELATSSMSAFALELREVDKWTQDSIAGLNSAARAAGLQAANEEDLAIVHQIAAQRAAAAIAKLRSSAAQLAEEIFGSPLDNLNEQIAAMEAAQHNSIQSVGDAAEDMYASQLSAIKGIKAWLDGELLGDLSTLTPEQKIAEATRQFQQTLALAQGGDANALQSITGQADALLQLGRGHWASGSQYTQLEAMVRAAMQGLVSTGPTAGSTGGDGGGSVAVVASPELQALYEQRDALAAQAENERRQAMVAEFVGMFRELIAATGDPLEEVASQLRINMTELAEAMGINLAELSATTAAGLVDMARQLGVDVGELADSVGVSLGTLADRQSLLNEALDQTLLEIPQEFRDQLANPLEAIRSATTESDATAAVEEAEAAILGMPQGIRDMLAPYFEGIKPDPIVTELSKLADLDAKAATQVDIMREIAAILRTQAESQGLVVPSYAVGTGYVPRDGLAYIHAGESVLPASVNQYARREGLHIGPSNGNNSEVVAELRELRKEVSYNTSQISARLEKLESTDKDGFNSIASATRQQTNVLQTIGR